MRGVTLVDRLHRLYVVGGRVVYDDACLCRCPFHQVVGMSAMAQTGRVSEFVRDCHRILDAMAMALLAYARLCLGY